MTNSDTKFIAYYRVSTTNQGESGLGLEAQQMAVNGYLVTKPGSQLIEEFSEVESGKKKNRPELTKSFQLCKQANLIIVNLGVL